MSVVQPFARPGVQPESPDVERLTREIARTLNKVNQGQMNCVLFVTLDPSVATTTVIDSRISLQTCASFMPQTANAAAEVPTLYATCTNGQMVVTHTNNALTDRTYTVSFLG